ncbi:hypothetical protein BDQ12DRAFT_663480 [Crucibulum laeve]|uniref:Uncharacterized protein n=1 Tax=Crucibulum laeve TaxID=68775 RepID=A0A5C3MBY1_9AGAR|nr:hypothetical protein BDQ12DRAFT_663480 [Crucibulum laeve]
MFQIAKSGKYLYLIALTTFLDILPKYSEELDYVACITPSLETDKDWRSLLNNIETSFPDNSQPSLVQSRVATLAHGNISVGYTKTHSLTLLKRHDSQPPWIAMGTGCTNVLKAMYMHPRPHLEAMGIPLGHVKKQLESEYETIINTAPGSARQTPSYLYDRKEANIVLRYLAGGNTWSTYSTLMFYSYKSSTYSIMNDSEGFLFAT